MTLFSGASRIEGVHPLQFGFVRRKIRTQRRYGMPIVNPLIFYPWRAYDFTRVAVRWVKLVRRYRKILKTVWETPDKAVLHRSRARPARRPQRADVGFREGLCRQDPAHPWRAGARAGGGGRAMM